MDDTARIWTATVHRPDESFISFKLGIEPEKHIRLVLPFTTRSMANITTAQSELWTAGRGLIMSAHTARASHGYCMPCKLVPYISQRTCACLSVVRTSELRSPERS